MPFEVTVVFTGKTIEALLAEGGTSEWRLNRSKASHLPYVLCARNARWGEGPEPHRTGFLLAKTKDVIPIPGRDGRYLIRFGEYAQVKIPNAWKKGDRNPVRYGTLAEFGIQPSTLQWKRMPLPAATASDLKSAPKPLTIAQAKAGLALEFNVPLDAIEITIRG